MVDVHTRKQRSYNMSQIRCKNTKPEINLRKFLWNKKLRGYRLNTKLYGKPDIVYSKFQIVIFIDGCQWHKCPRHFVMPKSNISFWKKKINSNVKRDSKVNEYFKKEGWRIIRVWEHDLKGKDINRNLTRIIKRIKKR